MQTGRDAGSVEAFRAAFQGRLMALSAAHTLLTAGNWEGASLPASLEQVLEPYAGEPAAPMCLPATTSGRAAAAAALVMAFHELATNAAKYGALSHHGGLVEDAGRSGATPAGGSSRSAGSKPAVPRWRRRPAAVLARA